MEFLRRALSDTWGARLSWTLSLAFALIIGFCLGAVAQTSSSRHASVLTLVADGGALVPTVDIRSWKGGRMEGGMKGEVRLLVDGEAVVPDGSGSFALGNVSAQGGTSAVPGGARFVASKRGKKYYPVGSASARNLSEANKIYFPDAAAAEAAGYVK